MTKIYILFCSVSQEYYELKNRQETPPWSERFENIVKYALHPCALRDSTPLRKGDFYIHISSQNNNAKKKEGGGSPRAFELKYMHGGETISRPLSMTDNILMCSENWTELLRSDIRDRFVFTSCVLWTNKGFERSSWTNLVQGHLTGGTSTVMETKGIFINHTYFLYLDLFNFYEINFSSSSYVTYSFD